MSTELNTPVEDHPFKKRVSEFPVDDTLRKEDGWDGIDVQWLITSDSVGTTDHVLGYTVIHPGGAHHKHRHPNAEEAQYLVQGAGVALVGDTEIEQQAGEVVFVPKGEWHGWRCTSEEPAVMLWTYGGATNLETAGYVRWEEEQ
jgi:quercetin dioxygenase-like cupin family protein